LKGPSGGAALAIGLCLELVERCLTNPRMGATGGVDLQGRLHRIGGVDDKAVASQNEGAEICILPKHNLDEVERGHFEDIPAPARDVARGAFRGAATVVEALAHAVGVPGE
jgi:ATP-dependent Lon protease